MGGDPSWSCFRLTAFVLKSFAQARSFVFIDPRELAATKAWIIRQQRADGSFPAVGRILNKDIQASGLSGLLPVPWPFPACPPCCLGPVQWGPTLLAQGEACVLLQGGIHGTVPLTAYVVAALLELGAASEVSTGAWEIGPVVSPTGCVWAGPRVWFTCHVIPGTCPGRYVVHLGTTPVWRFPCFIQV